MQITNGILLNVNDSDITNGTVEIPNSVTTIEAYAFAFMRCANLISVTIPSSLTSIGEGAFEYCKSLESVTIGNNVKSIGGGAFFDCESLTSITFPTSITSIGDYVFAYCKSLTSITIPDSITTIGCGAFENCIYLKTKPANYKAFKIVSSKLRCLDYTYTPNKWSDELDNIEMCESGYHFCTNLFEIFNYYHGELDKDIVIYECEVGDKVLQEADSSKCVTNRIKPVKRLYREDVIRILNGE